MRHSKKLLITAIAACWFAITCGAPAFAQTGITLNFNDPDDDRLDNIFFSGSSELRESGGVDNSGYLSVTDALNGQRGLIVLPDFNDGEALVSFIISADLRVGAGTDRPADGFSFNLVRPEDPLLEEPPGNYASSPVGEGNLPEEGSTTGLGIGFDEWQSGGADAGIPPNLPNDDPDKEFPGQNFNGIGVLSRNEPGARVTDPSCGPSGSLEASIAAGRDRIEHDCIGMSIRIDDELVKQVPFPILNGALDNDQSLQTGSATEAEGLGWAKLRLELKPDPANEENSLIWITYKDRKVIDGESFAYKPTPGQLVFGGRTGGANAAHHIDNIQILIDTVLIDLLGDFNNDKKIDLMDFNIMADNMYEFIPEGGYDFGDINFSQQIDLQDFVEFRAEYERFLAENGGGGGAAAVPEPSAALLSVMACLALAGLRRRRR